MCAPPPPPCCCRRHRCCCGDTASCQGDRVVRQCAPPAAMLDSMAVLSQTLRGWAPCTVAAAPLLQRWLAMRPHASCLTCSAAHAGSPGQQPARAQRQQRGTRLCRGICCGPGRRRGHVRQVPGQRGKSCGSSAARVSRQRHLLRRRPVTRPRPAPAAAPAADPRGPAPCA